MNRIKGWIDYINSIEPEEAKKLYDFYNKAEASERKRLDEYLKKHEGVIELKFPDDLK